MGPSVELRHLRYFVAVAEEGSLTVAAERRLHTAQPSLSRQIRDLEYKVVATQPLVVVLRRDHRLAGQAAIALKELAGEMYLGISDTAPTLRTVIEDYLKRSKVVLRPAQRLDNLAMAMSMVASTGGVALLPVYAESFLPPSVTSRPLSGAPPTVDLVIGYSKANTSRILGLFLSRLDQLRKSR